MQPQPNQSAALTANEQMVAIAADILLKNMITQLFLKLSVEQAIPPKVLLRMRLVTLLDPEVVALLAAQAAG